jgi:hypothetical protein
VRHRFLIQLHQVSHALGLTLPILAIGFHDDLVVALVGFSEIVGHGEDFNKW